MGVLALVEEPPEIATMHENHLARQTASGSEVLAGTACDESG